MRNSKKTVQKQAQNTSELEEVKQLKNQKLDVIVPIQFKNILLIPITANVVKLFGNKEINFQIKVKDKKLILEALWF